jgi:nicotinamide mononucleotide transporter
MSWLEIAGAVTGLLCVWLTVKENMWNWPIGTVNILFFLVMFFQVKLYGDMILQVVFLVLQIYGWWYWLQNRGKRDVRPTTRITRGHLALVSVAGLAAWVILGWFLASQTDASVPWIDSLTTAFSLVAQWLLGRKILENWHFWIACDVIDVGIYAYKGLYVTTGLYVVFTVLAIKGYLDWKRAMEAGGAGSGEAVV